MSSVEEEAIEWRLREGVVLNSAFARKILEVHTACSEQMEETSVIQRALWWKKCERPCYTIYVHIFEAYSFLRIAISKHFVETIFADQEFQVYGILKFR